MAKISAIERYLKLQEKRAGLLEKLQKLKEEIAKIDENMEYAEFQAWKEEKRTRNRVVAISGAGADAESDNSIIADAL